MKVRCKGYDTCDFKNECEHAKEHVRVGDGKSRTEIGDCMVETDIPCHCSHIYTNVYKRKEKLKAINESNMQGT